MYVPTYLLYKKPKNKHKNKINLMLFCILYWLMIDFCTLKFCNLCTFDTFSYINTKVFDTFWLMSYFINISVNIEKKLLYLNVIMFIINKGMFINDWIYVIFAK